MPGRSRTGGYGEGEEPLAVTLREFAENLGSPLAARRDPDPRQAPAIVALERLLDEC